MDPRQLKAWLNPIAGNKQVAIYKYASIDNGKRMLEYLGKRYLPEADYARLVVERVPDGAPAVLPARLEFFEVDLGKDKKTKNKILVASYGGSLQPVKGSKRWQFQIDDDKGPNNALFAGVPLFRWTPDNQTYTWIPLDPRVVGDLEAHKRAYWLSCELTIEASGFKPLMMAPVKAVPKEDFVGTASVTSAAWPPDPTGLPVSTAAPGAKSKPAATAIGAEGKPITFSFFQVVNKKETPLGKVMSVVKGGRSEVQWTVPRQPQLFKPPVKGPAQPVAVPVLFFQATVGDSVLKSDFLVLRMQLEWNVQDSNGKALQDEEFVLSTADGDEHKGTLKGGHLSMSVPAGWVQLTVKDKGRKSIAEPKEKDTVKVERYEWMEGVEHARVLHKEYVEARDAFVEWVSDPKQSMGRFIAQWCFALAQWKRDEYMPFLDWEQSPHGGNTWPTAKTFLFISRQKAEVLTEHFESKALDLVQILEDPRLVRTLRQMGGAGAAEYADLWDRLGECKTGNAAFKRQWNSKGDTIFAMLRDPDEEQQWIAEAIKWGTEKGETSEVIKKTMEASFFKYLAEFSATIVKMEKENAIKVVSQMIFVRMGKEAWAAQIREGRKVLASYFGRTSAERPAEIRKMTGLQKFIDDGLAGKRPILPGANTTELRDARFKVDYFSHESVEKWELAAKHFETMVKFLGCFNLAVSLHELWKDPNFANGIRTTGTTSELLQLFAEDIQKWLNGKTLASGKGLVTDASFKSAQSLDQALEEIGMTSEATGENALKFMGEKLKFGGRVMPILVFVQGVCNVISGLYDLSADARARNTTAVAGDIVFIEGGGLLALSSILIFVDPPLGAILFIAGTVAEAVGVILKAFGHYEELQTWCHGSCFGKKDKRRAKEFGSDELKRRIEGWSEEQLKEMIDGEHGLIEAFYKLPDPDVSLIPSGKGKGWLVSFKPTGLSKASKIVIDEMTVEGPREDDDIVVKNYSIDLLTDTKGDMNIGLRPPKLNEKSGALEALEFTYAPYAMRTFHMEMRMTIDLDGDGATRFTRKASGWLVVV